jgi:hypothetical protein
VSQQRACWSTSDWVDIEVTDDFHDSYGTTIDEGHIAIVLLEGDDGLVIEGASVQHLRSFIARAVVAIDEWETFNANCQQASADSPSLLELP